MLRMKLGCEAGDTLSSRHVSSCDVTYEVGMWRRGHTILTSRELMWCYVWSWDVKPGTHYPHVTWAHVMLRMKLGCEAGDTLSSRHVSSCNVTYEVGMWSRGHTILRSRELMWCYVWSWDVKPGTHYPHVTWSDIKLTFYFQLLSYPFPYVGSHMLISIICWLGVI